MKLSKDKQMTKKMKIIPFFFSHMTKKRSKVLQKRFGMMVGTLTEKCYNVND